MSALGDFALWVADTLTSANAERDSSDYVIDVDEGKIVYWSPEGAVLYVITVQEAEVVAKQ